MGTRNRQRRAEKQRRRQSPSNRQGRDQGRSGAIPRGGPSPEGSARAGNLRPGGRRVRASGQPTFDGAAVRHALFSAATAFGEGHETCGATLLAHLDEAAAFPGGPLLLETQVASCLAEALGAAWEGGWQPADVARLVRRRLEARHGRLFVDVAAADARRFAPSTIHPRWADQLSELGTEMWWDQAKAHLGQWAAREGVSRLDAMRSAVELLSLLIRLPRLPRLCEPPGEYRCAGPSRRSHVQEGQRSADGRVLERVRALLAKAESTTFAAEAEALTAKAQELMARHAIDRAMLEAGRDGGAEPVGARMGVDDPYAQGKGILLATVADANSCRTVWDKALGFATVMGFPADIETVEVLYTSLLVQATTAMVAAGPQFDLHGRSRTRSFRQSFLGAYAGRIGQRLRVARNASREAANEVYGEALLPVLSSRKSAVDDLCDTTFAELAHYTLRMSNAAGRAAGYAAAETAWLSPRAEVEPGVA